MHTRSKETPIRIAHLTTERVETDTVEARLGLSETVATVVSATSPESIGTVLADAPVDCVFVDPSVGDEDRETIVDRATDAGVAVLVFAPSAGSAAVESVLSADETEVVQSQPTEAPPSLLRRRLDTLRTERQTGGDGELVERILATSPVGIVVMDPDGAIQRTNEKAAHILDVDEDAIIGSHYAPDEICVRAWDGTQLGTDQFPFAEIKETGDAIRNREFVIEQQDGERTHITVDGVPLFEEGQLECVVIAFGDVTDRVEREQQLAEQRNQFAKLDRINRTLRGVGKALLEAETQAEILQSVCDRLSASGQYRFAIGLQTVEENRLAARFWPEFADAFVDSAFPIENATPETSVALRALTTGELQTVTNLDTRDADTTERAATDETVTTETSVAPDGSETGVVWETAAEQNGVESVAAIPISYGDTTYGVIVICAPHTDAFSGRETQILDELGRFVGDAIAAVESREREQTLTSLYETTQDLLTADTKAKVSEVVVEAGSDVLDLPGVGIFLFDDEENVLQPAAATDELLGFFDGSQTFGPGHQDSVTWQTYATGEPQSFRDVRDSNRVANPNTEARSSLLLPLGDHGVFVVASRNTGTLDDRLRQLVGLLAATTEAALDRVAGQAGIRERDRELAARATKLNRMDETLSLSRDMHEQLRDAQTRRGLERQICERVVELDSCVFAWAGTVPPETDEVTPTVWAGAEDGYLDSVSLAAGDDEPGARTAVTGDPTRIDNVTDYLRDHQWAREAADREFESVLSVPLTDGSTRYGVLVVYATQPDNFDDVLEPTLIELGRVAADWITQTETKRGLLTDQLVEIKVRITEEKTFLNAVASLAGEPVRYRDVTPREGSLTEVLFSVSDPPTGEILDLAEEFVTVESVTAVEHSDGLFRVALSCEPVLSKLIDCGALPQMVTAHRHETTATVRVPQELGVRVFLDRLQELYPEAELRTRRDIDDKPREPLHNAFEGELTERQREVLVTAYESGFFQSPRETTGEELAELLGISQPTVTHHLRAAQHGLFGTLFEEIE